MPNVSELIGTAVVGSRGHLGRVRDVSAMGSPVASVSSVTIDDDRRIPFGSLTLYGRVFRVSEPLDEPAGEEEFSIGRDLLDRQILDARGMKVVRVNDVRLEHAGGTFRVTGVDVGARGFLRRISPGMERLAVRIADTLGYALSDTVIPWSYVASLEPSSGVRLGVDRAMLAKLRPVEVAELLAALEGSQRSRVLRIMEDPVLANALYEASSGIQEETLAAIGDARAAGVLEIMPPDEAADVLGTLPPETTERLLERISEKDRSVLRKLLGYHPRTAGGLMTPEFVAIRHDTDVGGAIEVLRRDAPEAESVYYVYAVDERGRLRGVVPLRALLTADADSSVRTITRTDVVHVDVDDLDDVVAETMERYDLLALPVVDPDGVLHGIITVDDVMRTVEERASSDLAAITGTAEAPGSGDPARPTTFAPGRLGGLAWAIGGGSLAALALARAGHPSDPWLALGALPLLLRLAQDEGAWALTAYLQQDVAAAHRAIAEIAGSVLAALPAAALLGTGAALTGGRRLGVALGIAALIAPAVAASLGLMLPAFLVAMRRDVWMRRGRVVPLAASLGGLVVYVALLTVLR